MASVPSLELDEDVQEAARAYVGAAKANKLPTATDRAISYRGVAARHNITVREFTDFVDSEARALARKQGIKLA